MSTHMRRHIDHQIPRLIATFVVFPLMGAPCVMADGPVGETRVSAAQPGRNIGPLLLKLEQQIAAEHVALPKSDNASETWLLVIAEAYPTTPEIRSALANFATHALDRATTERAAGREVAATEFQVFADLATDLLNKEGALTTSPESPSASYSAGTPRVSSSSAFPATGAANLGAPQSVDTTSTLEAAQPNRANEPPPPGGPATPGMSSSADAPGADATRLQVPASQAALIVAPGPSAPAAVLNSASPAPYRGNTAHPTAQTGQTPRAVAPWPPAPAAVLDIASAAPYRGNTAHSTAQTAQTPLAVAPWPSAPAAVLNSASAAPYEGNTAHPTAHAGQTALAAAPPTAASITPLPTIQDQSLAALYATRGDQMLAIKDVSAARRLYEYAANAGSARAATALAQTFDPSFLTRVGVVGLKPDPALAAIWYGKAVALGDRDAKTLLRNLNTEAAK